VRRPRSSDDAHGTPLLALSELALLGVHLAVVLGFGRLYRDWSYLSTLTTFVVSATALSVITRRLRLRVPLVIVIAVGGGVLAATWLLFPSTTHLGLPTRATLDAAHDALEVSRARFDKVAAPAPVLPGFQLMAGVALWWAVWFADWAAFRLRTTVEAVTPAAVLFVFGALLGSGRYQIASAVAFTATVLLFVSAHRALRAQLDHLWLTTSPVAGPRAVLRAGVTLALVGVLLGAAVGTRLPGAQAEPMVRWRNQSGSGGDRTTVSPIVDLRKRLVDQSNAELFTVRTSHRSYQRLTALDRFDGQLWSSGGQFSPASTQLASTSPDSSGGQRITQKIRIRSLAAIWAPAAFEAVSVVKSSKPLRWDDESATLIVDRSQPTSDGLTYTVVSDSPELDPGTLDRARGADPRAIAEHYEQLPASFPAVAARTARSVTAEATTRYRKALALQNWFRANFTYSLDVPPGHSDDALVSFLKSRAGYCEQFAGAYAAMARSLGIPARVAVGFTPGDADPDDPTLYRVRGRHAHAWPELWFTGIGWVPFEPTPGRGIPGATSYTGIPEEQDQTRPQINIVTTTTTTTTLPGATTAVPATTTPANRSPLSSTPASGSDGSGPGPGTALVLLVAAVAIWLATVLLAPIVVRRRGPRHGAGAIGRAWHHVGTSVRWQTGLVQAPSETPREFALRAARPLGPLAVPVAELAALVTRSTWDPTGPRPADDRRATELARDLRHQVDQGQSWLVRLRRRLSWREAFDRPRPTTVGLTPAS